MSLFSKLSVAAIVLALPFSGAQAQTFFGSNDTPNQSASGAPVTARSNFLSNLSGVSTETFDGFAQGTAPTTLTFTGSAGLITATLSGGGTICRVNNCRGQGRFATSGTGYYDTSSAFSASFSEAISAFGFYGTDIGDVNGVLSLELIRANGANSIISVTTTANRPDGNLLFFGVIDQANPFTGVRFLNSAAGTDFFGFDDMTVGDARQVTPSVPEPATWAMMMLGFGGMGYAMRRGRKTRVRFA